MGLRKGVCYRGIVRAYTRKSKVKSKAYIKTVPSNKVVRYEMGDPKGVFTHEVKLVCKQDIQLRHNCIESMRQVVTRRIEGKAGTRGFFMKLKVFPHHILRENKMISGAHADRLQKGMQKAFGRSMGLAAQCQRGKVVFSIFVNKDRLNDAVEAAKLAPSRLPGKYIIEVGEAENNN